AGVRTAADVVRAVANQDRALLLDFQLVQDLVEHAGLRLEAVPVVPADDVGKVVRAISLQNLLRVLQRLIGGDGLARSAAKFVQGLYAGLEAIVVDAVGREVAYVVW